MRTGNWIATYTGVQFYLTDPHPDDVRIKDIAHALSMACRFGGHTSEFYSVAQHSVHCSELAEEMFPNDRMLQLHALLHDASEAYIGDVVRPLKVTLPGYKELEEYTMQVIYAGLLIPPISGADAEQVKNFDDTLLMTERRDFISHKKHDWTIAAEPWHEKLGSMSPTAAEYQFNSRYQFLRDLLVDSDLLMEGGQ